ncbi:MAG: TetR/AcrR family transcriptional regulator C-terminal domain-containing protein [Solirubrobacterales bacterium]|nr:TetR/AcrR family transcriptional regulator C-terminal domain-containing protein [Solirubrobacterales bacterium]
MPLPATWKRPRSGHPQPGPITRLLPRRPGIPAVELRLPWFYERGPGRTIDTLASTFEQLDSRGVPELDEPRLAAAHFNWLVMSIPLNQAMLLGQDEPATPAELKRYADAGVRTFLAAYGKR